MWDISSEQAENVGSGSSDNGIPFVVVAWDDRTEMEGEIECLEYKVGATVQLWYKRWLETPAVNTDYGERETRHQVFPNLTGSKKEVRACVNFAGNASHNHIHSLLVNQTASRRQWSGLSGHALVIYPAKHNTTMW